MFTQTNNLLFGRKALVVGGTSGIGRGIAIDLAKRGVTDITIAGRCEIRANQVVSELNEISSTLLNENKEQENKKVSNHKFAKVDGFDLRSIRDLASDHETELDFLVMTQSMATLQGFTPTINGFDQKMQLHHYSRMLLINILAPTLAKSSIQGGGKVISVLSAGVHGSYKSYRSDPLLEKNYTLKNAADAAGFYNDLMLDKFAQKYPNINFSHAAPGFVNTNWGSEMPPVVKFLIRGLQYFGRSYEDSGKVLTAGWLRLGPGFNLINQDGAKITEKVTSLHEEGKDFIWDHTMKSITDYQ